MSGAEFALNTTQTVTNFIAGRLAATGWNAVVARLKVGRRTESLGGSTDQRQEAYSQLRWSVIEYRTSIATLTASPPRLVGALWSVPLYLRMLHRIPDLSSEVLDRLLAVHTVGRLPAIEAADALLITLASAADVYSDTTGNQPGKRVERVGVELAKVDEALADFTVAVRGDLGFGDARTEGDPAPRGKSVRADEE
jgi:hypothetical protein